MFGLNPTAPAEQVVTGAALAINDRATAAMYMLAAARECLTDSDGESLVFDRFDYEAALEAAARRVGEQMHRRGGLRLAKVSGVIEAALNTMSDSIPAEGSGSVLDAADVHDLAVCMAVEFWSVADATDCARIAAVVSQPVPEPGELAPAAFAELVLHAGSAFGWEALSEEERNGVPDSDGNLGRVPLERSARHAGLAAPSGARPHPRRHDDPFLRRPRRPVRRDRSGQRRQPGLGLVGHVSGVGTRDRLGRRRGSL